MKLEQLRSLGWKDSDIIELLEELLERFKTSSCRMIEDASYEEENHDCFGKIMESIPCKSQFNNSTELQKKVTELLKKVGIPPHLLGMEYLKAAILYCVERGVRIVPLYKELYPEIAEIYKSKPVNVERVMRNAIEKCFEQYNDERDEIFGGEIYNKSGVPSNKRFIAVIVDYILGNDCSK